MKRLPINFRRSVFIFSGICLALILGLTTILNQPVFAAAQLQNRSLTLSSTANGTISTDFVGNAVAAGAGGNGVKTKHTFSFKIGTTGNVGSILFMYCTTPVPGTTCTTPTGMTANNLPNASATLATTGLNVAQAFAVDKTTTDPTGCNGGTTVRDNCVLIKRSSAVSETATTTVTVAYGGTSSDYITNPSTDNYTFFVRISTYSDLAYTTQVDYGTVASATAQQVDITAKVQERLNFSVGTTPTAPTAACNVLTGSTLALGDTQGFLDSATAYAANSYFRISTNAVNGSIIQYSGDTLKSGANSIASVGEGVGGTSSSPGSSQFGLGLDSSDTQSGNGYSFTQLAGVSTPTYNSANGTITAAGTAKFSFNTASTTTPKNIATSTGGITCDTGSVRYLGNITTNTQAGIYTTTITYLAIPTF